MNILIPRNLDSRKEKLHQDRIKFLSQEIIEGDLIIDTTFDGISKALVKVKEIRGHVNLRINKAYIPEWLKDVKIYGYLNCSKNNLKTLENCPQYVGKSFWCNDNKLTSLEGCPKYIGRDLICCNNKIKLKLPKDIELKGKFYDII